jgi:hypothetical protein
MTRGKMPKVLSIERAGQAIRVVGHAPGPRPRVTVVNRSQPDAPGLCLTVSSRGRFEGVLEGFRPGDYAEVVVHGARSVSARRLFRLMEVYDVTPPYFAAERVGFLRTADRLRIEAQPGTTEPFATVRLELQHFPKTDAPGPLVPGRGWSAVDQSILEGLYAAAFAAFAAVAREPGALERVRAALSPHDFACVLLLEEKRLRHCREPADLDRERQLDPLAVEVLGRSLRAVADPSRFQVVELTADDRGAFSASVQVRPDHTVSLGVHLLSHNPREDGTEQVLEARDVAWHSFEPPSPR